MEKKIIWQKTWVVCIIALICCLLWGSAFPGIKIGYRLFEIPSDNWNVQLLFAGIRFVLAGVLVIIIGSVINKKILVPKRSSFSKIAVLGLFQTLLQYIFFYIGLAHTTGFKASVINAVNVFFSLLIASLIFHQEKLTIKKIIGCIIGFSGVVYINMSGAGGAAGINWGDVCIICTAASAAFSSVFAKIFSKYEDPVTLSGYQFVFGGILLTLIGLISGGRLQNVTYASIGILLYLAFVSAVAYSLWGILLKYNDVSRVTVFGFINPVFGVILSGIFLGEGEQAFSLQSLIALILVSVGIYVVNIKK